MWTGECKTCGKHQVGFTGGAAGVQVRAWCTNCAKRVNKKSVKRA